MRGSIVYKELHNVFASKVSLCPTGVFKIFTMCANTLKQYPIISILIIGKIPTYVCLFILEIELHWGSLV